MRRHEQMLIKNYKELATEQSRAHALEILNAGLIAISPENVAQEIVKIFDNKLYVRDNMVCDLSIYERVFLVGAGKVAASFAEELEKMLGSKLTKGIVMGTVEKTSDRTEYIEASHPLPSQKNVEGTKKLIDLVLAADKNDLVISVITGGGSSMMELPDNMSIEKQAELTKLLMRAGADIFEVNTIRKHTSKIKGGYLAQYAAGSNMIGLIFSDVIGNDLSMVASGPTVFDSTTITDAEMILKKHNLWDFCTQNECKLNETPKDRQILDKVKNYLIVDNKMALVAMEQKARELGYKASILDENLSGEARYVGSELLKRIEQPGQVLIAGGETTVKVRGFGKGGRNQELVLSALSSLKDGEIIVSCSSDGVDNNTEFAGAIGDKQTVKKAQEKMLSPEIFLDNNDSANFFEQEGDGIKTGKLASNVADLMLVLSAKSN